MRTISQDEYKKLYGADSLAQFNQPQAQQSGGYGQGVADAFKSSVDYAKQGVAEGNPTGQGGLRGLLTGVGKIGMGALGAITAPVAPAFNATVGKGIQAAGDALSNTKPLQEWGQGVAEQGIPANQNTGVQDFVEGVQNYAGIAGAVAGGVKVPAVANKVGDVLTRVPKTPEIPPSGPTGGMGNSLDRAGQYVRNTTKDLLGTPQNFINHQISKALDLTPGDLKTIEQSTGNDVGTWLSDHNLIGSNKATTQANIQDFFKQNYDAVRSEIGKVTKTYKQYQVPRYVDALKQIKTQIDGVPGLEKEGAQVDNLLNMKKDLTLSDVQTAKELLDKHFSLYKSTGDVKDSVTKSGLSNIRGEIRGFIEKEVKDNTGADIKQLNNNVSTARSLDDVITTRAPKTLTKSNLTTRDIATGWAASTFGGPLVGVAAVLIKKIATSPTVRLRLARLIDSFSDAQKARAKAQLDAGEIPPEFNKVLSPTLGQEGATKTQ